MCISMTSATASDLAAIATQFAHPDAGEASPEPAGQASPEPAGSVPAGA